MVGRIEFMRHDDDICLLCVSTYVFCMYLSSLNLIVKSRFVAILSHLHPHPLFFPLSFPFIHLYQKQV